MMDINDVKDTILKWIYSCDTIEQVEGLELSIGDIINTFGKTESDIVIRETKFFLSSRIQEQKIIIKRINLHL